MAPARRLNSIDNPSTAVDGILEGRSVQFAFE